MSDLRGDLVRLPILLGLFAALLSALVPGYQDVALSILIFTPLCVAAVTGVTLIAAKRYGAGISFLVSVAMAIAIAFWGGLPK
ncbi:MAG: hypothetical protein C4341_07970 [Armatimonadota bacterium]